MITHTTYSHTTGHHTTCSHTPCPHTTCHHTTCSHTTCPHTQLVHTQFVTTQLVTTQLTHTHRSSLCVAGVALMALGWLWWRAWVPVDAVDAAALCLAGAALGDMDRHFAWQAWHLATSTFTLRGVDAVDTPALCVAGVALGDIDVHFAWQVWHLWHWTGSGDALGRLFAWQARHLATSTVTLRGRCGTSRHRPSLCVAGVALRDIDRHLRGRRGTYGTGLALVALCSRLAPWAPPLFAWQACIFADPVQMSHASHRFCNCCKTPHV